MSQGFRLINDADYQIQLQKLKYKLKQNQYANQSNKKQDEVILDIMTGNNSLVDYLDDHIAKNYEGGQLDFGSRNQVANTQLKRKQLFMMFRSIIEAQEVLVEFSARIAAVCNGTLKQPPGAYYGVKDFHGALDKITNRIKNV